MSPEKKVKERKKALAYAFFTLFSILIIIGATSVLAPMSMLEPTSYQGPQAYFVKVYDYYLNDPTTNQDLWIYSSAGTSIDGIQAPQYGSSECQFYAKISDVFLDPSSNPSYVNWLTQGISEIMGTAHKVHNNFSYLSPPGPAPVKTYHLIISNKTVGDETITNIYAMKEYQARFIVWAWAQAGGYNDQNTYVIWIRIDLNQPWQNWYLHFGDKTLKAQEVYFGIGKILAHLYVAEKTQHDGASFSPSDGQVVALYTSTNLEQQPISSSDIENSVIYHYQGAELNPAIFRKCVYIKLVLRNFGTHYPTGILGAPNYFAWYGDAVTWVFDMDVFVIGHWVVKNVHKMPTNIQPKNPSGGWNPTAPTWGDVFKAFLTNPILGIGALLAGLGGMLALMIYCPEIFIFGGLLFTLFGFRRPPKPPSGGGGGNSGGGVVSGKKRG